MIIIVGLGNPGKKFEKTRHNAGFMTVDFFAQQNNFPKFTLSKKYESLTSENNEILLAKPQTFMNESGKAVASILKNTNAENVIVVRDDIDLPMGTIKLSKDSGSGGHKGIDSVIQHLGNNNFIQLKIGIATNDKKAEEVVLKKFSKEEMEILNNAIKKSAQALNYFIENGIEKTMNEFNR
jgi:PTH1 family peptidyl-tRNA hydrolase